MKFRLPVVIMSQAQRDAFPDGFGSQLLGVPVVTQPQSVCLACELQVKAKFRLRGLEGGARFPASGELQFLI